MKPNRTTAAVLHALTVVVLLASFVLRLYRLDAQSLWYDEGNSAVMAGRSVSQIIVNAAADIHPPLYYLLLHWWSQAAGMSEFALRYFSVAFGMLAVAAAVALGRRFWGTTVGIVAGSLAAASPFLVYYAQEARMYAQLCAMATLSTYAFVRLTGIGGTSGVGPSDAVESVSTEDSTHLDPALPAIPAKAGLQGLGEPRVLPVSSPAGGPSMGDSHANAGSPRYSRTDGTDGESSPVASQECCKFAPPRGHGVKVIGRDTLLPVAYILITSAMLYTHYFGFSILLAQAALVLLLVLRRYPLRSAARLFLAQATAVVLYIPWLPALLRQLGTWSTGTAHTSLGALWHNVFLVFSFGLSWDATTTSKSELLVGVVVVVGMVSDLIRRRSMARGTSPYLPAILLFLLVPLGVVSVQEMRQPTYQPKLVIPAAIAFELLLAAGVVGIATLLSRAALGWGDTAERAADRGSVQQTAPKGRARQTAVAIAAVLILLAVIGFFDSRSLRAYYFDPKYGRDDYRGVARFLEAQGTDGDAIVLNAPNQIEVLDYYYRGSVPRYPLPRQRPLDKALTENDLTDLASHYKRVWVVEWAVNESDPEGFMSGWLAERYRAFEAGQFGRVRLLRYDPRS